jgi:hypothetical protein
MTMLKLVKHKRPCKLVLFGASDGTRFVYVDASLRQKLSPMGQRLGKNDSIPLT